jgi:hypothetical protein
MERPPRKRLCGIFGKLNPFNPYEPLARERYSYMLSISINRIGSSPVLLNVSTIGRIVSPV